MSNKHSIDRGRQIWTLYVAPELIMRPEMSDVEIETVAQVAASMVAADDRQSDDAQAVSAYLIAAREAVR